MALSAYERWKQKKEQEEKQQKATQPAATEMSPYQRWRQKKQAETQAEIAKQADSLLSGHNAMVTQHNKRYLTGNDRYRGDSAAYLDDVTARRETLRSQADALQDAQGMRYMDRDALFQLAQAVTGAKRSQNAIVKAAEQDHGFWSQFGSEEEYNEYYARQKDYEEKLNFDLTTGEEEVQRLKSALDEARSLRSQIANAQTNSGLLTMEDRVAGWNSRLDEIAAEYGSLDALQEQYTQRSQYLNQARHIQEGYNLTNGAQNAEDFYRLSMQDSSVSDVRYRYINDPEFRADYQALLRISDPNNPVGAYDNLYEAGLDLLNDSEKAIYNYYYAKEGADAANRYLTSIRETLNQRRATGIYEGLEDNTALELIFGVEAGLDQFKSGVGGLVQMITGESDYIPQSPVQMASGMVREDLADDGFKLTEFLGGASIGQVGYDAITTTANMAPSILTSMAVGILNPVAGEVTGAALMGASATGSAYREMLNLGYDKDQSRAYAAMVGASEAGLQYLLGGISSMGGKLTNSAVGKLLSNVDNAIARTAIKLGGNMLSEGFEEGLQEVLTPWFQSLVTGEVFKISSAEVLYSSLLGALTAGFLEGGGTVSGEVNTYRTGQQLQGADISTKRLAELGQTFSADTVAYQLAGRVNENTGAYTMGRLFNEIGATLTEQNQSEIAKSLVRKGIDSRSANTISKALADVVEGATLTEQQIRVLDANEHVAKTFRDVIINQNSTVNQRTNAYNEALMALANEKSGVSAAAKPAAPAKAAPDTTRTEQSLSRQENVSAADTVDTRGENGTQSRYEASGDGKTYTKANPSQPVTIREVASIKDGKMTLRLEDGSTVDAKDVEYASQDEALIYETVAQMGVNTSAANILVNAYHTAAGVDASVYAHGIQEAYRYGQLNIPVQEVAKGPFSSMLTEHQRRTAYKLGQMFGGKQVAKEQATVSRKERVAEESSAVGKVHFERNGRTFDEVREVSLKTMEQLAAVLGVEFHVFESYENAAGKRVYKDANGKETAAPNGWYDPKDSSIHIDLNAGKDGKGTMLFTVAHELTHFIRQWSPAKFKVLANFLNQQYVEKGISVSALVDEQIAKAKRNGRDISHDEAYEEVVADSMVAMLTDGNVVQLMAELRQRDKTLWQKICDWFKDLVADLKALVNTYENLAPDSIEGRAVAEMQDVIVTLESLYMDALVDASKNRAAAGAQKNTTPEGGEKYSFKGYAEDGKGIYESNFPKGTPKKAKGERILRYIQDVWSKKPITLRIEDASGVRYIEAQFDPTFDEGENVRTDASKLMGGNRHGTAAEQRVTLDLADDYYQLASESRYNGSKEETGKQSVTHQGVKMWHYFVNDIYFAEYDSDKLTPYTVSINVKEKSDGNFFYSFSAEQAEKNGESSTQRTLHAVVNSSNEATANGNLSKTSISDSGAEVKEKFSDRDSALKHFGRTYNWKETGHLLTDGSKLDFSGRHEGASGGYRTVDHRVILDIYPEDAELDGNGAMVDFMKQGNIRIMPESDGINLQTKPTKAQERALDDFISKARGEVILDIDDERGNTVVSVEYPRYTRASKVLQDIRNYFDTGAEPRASQIAQFHYSLRDPAERRINEVLQQENTQLKEDVSYLKELLKLQRSVTGGTKFTKSSVEAAAANLVKANGAKGEKRELAKLLNDFYEYIAKGEELTWEGVMEQARGAADWIRAHTRTRAQIDSYAADILRELRGSRINLDEQQKQEAAYRFGSYNEFRKKLMGSIAVADQGSVSLDTKWAELAERYPNIFNPDTTATDMPAALMDAVDTLRNMRPSGEYGIDEDMAQRDLLNQIYDSYWRVSTLRTVADVKQRQIMKLKGEHSRRMEKLREFHREKTAQLKQEYRNDLKQVKLEYRIRAEKKQQEIIARYQESRKKGIESRSKTAMRHKIQNVVKELNQYLLRGTKERHVPIELQKAVAEALDAVNMDTVGAEQRITRLKEELMKAKTPEAIQDISRKIDNVQAMGDRMKDRLQALKDAYDKFVNSDDPLIANAHDEVIASKLESIIETVGDTPLRDMTLAQLEDVYDMYRMVLTTIRNANKTFKQKKSESIAALGNRVMTEVRQVGGKKTYRLKGTEGLESFDWNNLKPVYAFERIGSGTLTEIFGNVRAGEDVWAKDVTEAREYYLARSKKYNYDTWDFGKRHRFTSSSGMNFELGLEQIMSLYAYSKREQAAEHLRRGGIVIDETTEVTMKSKLGVPLKFNPTEATAYNISIETLADIVSKLTGEQKAFVDEMQEYLSSTMGEKGNEVSLELYGIKLFKEKFYFPLKSAAQFMAKAKEQQQGEAKIKNSGFSKETVRKASNPVVLTPFMDVWANHVNEMSMYHAFVLPMEDFYRVYNFKTPTSETSATESVEMFIQNAYGKGATKYIDQLLKDLNGGARSDPRETFSKSLMSKFKKASVMASLSVVVQQPTSIIRAMALVDAKYFGPAPVTRGVVRTANARKHKALWNEVKQYAPVAVIKEMGHFDTNMGRSTLDFIKAKEYKNLTEKAKGFFTDSGYRDEVISRPAALGDELAWVAIWDAVKKETMDKRSDLTVGSEAFLKAAGKRFTEVVTKTQVYDSVLARSGNMRSKTAFMNMWTSFMAEPTTSINILQDALLKAKRGNKRYAAKAIGAVYGSVILNAALVSLVYAMRDDDEDETFAEKYLARLTTEVIDGINPLTYIPFLKDVWSIMQGYDIERSDMSLITDLVDTLQKTVKVLATDTEGMDTEELAAHEKKVVEALWGMVDNINSLAGVPVKNVRRDINGILNLFGTLSKDIDGRQTTVGSLLDKIQADIHSSTPIIGWLPGEKKGDRLYDAVTSGDKAYTERLKGSYSSESTYNTALGNAVKERVLDGEIDAGAAADFLEDHAGRTGTEAMADVQYWLFTVEHPEVSASASWFDKYYEDIVDSGVTLEMYIDYRDQVRELSKKAEKLPVIDALPITSAQKDALYFAEGWAESTLNEAPWHQ